MNTTEIVNFGGERLFINQNNLSNYIPWTKGIVFGAKLKSAILKINN